MKKRSTSTQKNRTSAKKFRSALTEVAQRTAVNFPVQPQGLSEKKLSTRLICSFHRMVNWAGKLAKQAVKHRGGKRHMLALLEMQQLGDKRFVAVVRVGKQKFLIGGAATSVSLLAELQPKHTEAIPTRVYGQEMA